ncbi:hypothetical protein IQ260_07970 [Leptolyngbya cf. ectocarpi LEGE 11479]|uniref:Uncharacterized protein n=1 Tax=Leptolyngbya cf. ectocarpi LEGE 11479 TaxID=1828722 RepID=A0A928X191_LEPEC|nr:hypothetical protein [Leptolyngbya ectocarpi]MBE9066587.1 hypothetical protein [Leptolyngbya cf. ectocarpi LEGE 11479]
MNTYSSNLQELEIQRRQLERQWQPTPSQRFRQIAGNWLSTAGNWLLKALTEGDQLRIWTKETESGTLWWVYNPIDGKRQQFGSEHAMRVWFEERYKH